MSLEDVHKIAENFLRDYIDSQNPLPLAETVESRLHVNFIRCSDGKYFCGIKRNGAVVWSRDFKFASKVPENIVSKFNAIIGHEALPVWAL